MPLRSLSSPSRGTWIEICTRFHVNNHLCKSSPSRGTWIEITVGGVTVEEVKSSPSRGTWIEIRDEGEKIPDQMLSSPSRGTWIEICWCWGLWFLGAVVPLTGDVD